MMHGIIDVARWNENALFETQMKNVENRFFHIGLSRLVVA